MGAVREINTKADVQAPVSWVMGIAKHKLLDHYRREEREERRLALAYSAEATEAWPDRAFLHPALKSCRDLVGDGVTRDAILGDRERAAHEQDRTLAEVGQPGRQRRLDREGVSSLSLPVGTDRDRTKAPMCTALTWCVHWPPSGSRAPGGDGRSRRPAEDRRGVPRDRPACLDDVDA